MSAKMDSEKDKKLLESLFCSIRGFQYIIENINDKQLVNYVVKEVCDPNINFIKKNIQMEVLKNSQEVVFNHMGLIVCAYDYMELLAKKITCMDKVEHIALIHPYHKYKFYFSLNEIEGKKIDLYSRKDHNNIQEIDEDIEVLNNQIMTLERVNALKGQEEGMEVFKY